MSVKVRGGVFSTRRYHALNEEGLKLKTTGAEILLRFTPEPDLDADVVSLVQVVKDTVAQTGVSEQLRQKSGAFERRAVGENGADNGATIDQEPYDKHGKLVNLDPRYTEQRLTASEPLRQKPVGLFQLPTTGYAAQKKEDGWTTAELRDRPAIEYPLANLLSGGMEFEVVAMAEKGEQKWYVGSVCWGWRVNKGLESILTPTEIQLGDYEQATPRFFKAAIKWNEAHYAEDLRGYGRIHKAMPIPVKPKLALTDVYVCQLDEYLPRYSLLRFYPDGLVLSAHVEVQEDIRQAWSEINYWFHREGTNTTSGLYIFDGETLSFSTTSWEGTVDYAGFGQDDKIILNTHSHINGYSAKNQEYTRLKVPS